MYITHFTCASNIVSYCQKHSTKIKAKFKNESLHTIQTFFGFFINCELLLKQINVFCLQWLIAVSFLLVSLESRPALGYGYFWHQGQNK
jgi:hypothetical protein